MNKVSKQIEINAPVEAVFDLFSSFNHFSRWMKGVKKVEPVAAGRTRWTVQAPDGALGEWEAEIADLEPGRRVTWRSTGGNIEAEGEASFAETRLGATLLRLALGYDTPEGNADKLTAAAFNQDLEQRLEDDLIWFRLYAERTIHTAGEVESMRRMPAASLPSVNAKWPARRVADKSSVHFETFSAIRRAGQMIQPARLVTSFLTGVGAAARRRAKRSPIIVNLDQPANRRSDEDATVLTAQPRAAVRVRIYRPLLAGAVVTGLLFIISAGWIQASRWPTDPSSRAQSSTTARLPTDRAQHDKPAAAAGLKPTATFEPDAALLAVLEERTAKAQQKAPGKRARGKRGRTRWVTVWLNPVIKPFARKKAARRDD